MGQDGSAVLTKFFIKLAFSLSDVLAFAFLTLNEMDKIFGFAG